MDPFPSNLTKSTNKNYEQIVHVAKWENYRQEDD